jgi:hypothetical protein
MPNLDRLRLQAEQSPSTQIIDIKTGKIIKGIGTTITRL